MERDGERERESKRERFEANKKKYKERGEGEKKTSLGLTCSLPPIFSHPKKKKKSAWGIELTDDYSERSKLFGIQQVFYMIGTIASTGLPVVLFQYFKDVKNIFMEMTIATGVVMIATSFVGFLYIPLFSLLPLP